MRESRGGGALSTQVPSTTSSASALAILETTAEVGIHPKQRWCERLADVPQTKRNLDRAEDEILSMFVEAMQVENSNENDAYVHPTGWVIIHDPERDKICTFYRYNEPMDLRENESPREYAERKGVPFEEACGNANLSLGSVTRCSDCEWFYDTDESANCPHC